MRHVQRSNLPRRQLQRVQRPRLPKTLSSMAAVWLLLTTVMPASGVEIGVNLELGNQGFAYDRDFDDDGIPKDEFLFGGTITGAYNPTDFLTLELIADRDQILQNSLTSRLAYRGDRVRFAMGPSFGLFNQPDQHVAPGLSTEASVDVLPRLNAAAATTRPMQRDVSSDGDYRQRFDRLALSTYGDNLIVTLLFEQSRFRELDDGTERTNRLRRYALRTEAFAKGVPYRVIVSGEFHDRSFSFKNDDENRKQTYGTLVLGTGITYEPRPGMSYRVLLESGLYNFGRDDLLGEFEDDVYLFRVRTGISFSL